MKMSYNELTKRLKNLEGRNIIKNKTFDMNEKNIVNSIDEFYSLLTHSYAPLYPLIFPLTLNFSQNNTRHLYITQKAVCLTDRISFYKKKKET